ncbi:DNA repair protein RadC [uncultured Brevundimonas sp.]|uniref:RadC family protein n=1 Tax=uncultured Brevundimonas sp. TaxID=213418 RepID=UPI0025D4945B|nr:DNA repair protein RadC [uncultured Brevundimonas sp.]
MRSFIAVLRGPDHVFEFVNSAHRAAFGDRDLIGRTRAEVFPELDHQGLADAPHKAFRTGEPIFVRDKSVKLDWSPAGQPLRRRLDISYEPMRDAHGVVCGLFVQGRDVTTIGAHSLEERALAHGLDILSDTELLTLFLYHCTLDTDSADRAEHLLKRFGTLRGVLSASIPSLQQLVPAKQMTAAQSVPTSAALHIKLARELGRRVLFNKIAAKPILASSSAVRAYLQGLLEAEPREKFLVMFLDRSHRLIALETMAEGSISHAPVYTREVVRRAVELSASGMILVHNHPSGSEKISKADVSVTTQIARAAAVLDVELIDHLVVAGPKVIGFVERGLLPPSSARR